ncbi:hypothetical protein GCM10023187_18620 [Nibrella viscosa]|uniref:Glycosyl transferase n=1 Tax=Nibrella viscosa TaxID=1084524 RepID=A0ABP8KAL5_9BACT
MKKHVASEAAAGFCARPRVDGKFITIGGETFYIKGVTYGTFQPGEHGNQFPLAADVEKDFSQMASHGVNAVRTYTVPPRYLLDLAHQHNLKVMVGLPWEQHITFLDERTRIQGIIQRVQEGVQACAHHPAVLCYTIGNEIPAQIVRWYGPKRIERFLHQLFRAVKTVDPEGLVTYVNYPTTEYLSLPFLDFDCFNVYLETEEKLSIYLARLHNLTGDRPLVLAEIGLDSMRNGEEKQAAVLDWQIRTIFGKGCAGTFVFAWTDEWWRGGFEIEDWDFGIVDRQREPKLALEAVQRAFSDAPFATARAVLPKISVIVCSYNGSATIRDTLDGLLKLDYPNYEVIVVNDGSTDQLACIAGEYPFRLISTPNRGLSNARNTGLYAATGEIVAYIDDDAYPDPHWLHYLAYSYLNTNHAGVGGPNLLPGNDGPIAMCVFHAPGGPVHVLTTDEIAEHIPGCNMSFRREVLLEIGGFDPIYRAAGDDVDVCWRVQQQGYTIGFHPSATVWHHRRNSLKAYWKQQQGYGRAEALLEQKWPEKYNGMGHVSWGGRIYGNGVTQPLSLRRSRIFHGVWGSAPFQSVYQPASGLISYLPLMPEWYLLTGFLCFLTFLGLVWSPLLWVLPAFIAAFVIIWIQSGVSAAKARLNVPQTQRLAYWALITALHAIQPMARLYGRLTYGLTPWRKRGPVSYRLSHLFSRRIILTKWSENWRSAEDWLGEVESRLKAFDTRVRSGGEFDAWDLQVSGSLFSSVRGLLTVEEHGGGKQLVRFKCWPTYSAASGSLLIGMLSLCGFAVASQSYVISAVFGLVSVLLLVSFFTGKARALAAFTDAFQQSATEILPEESLPSNDELLTYLPVTAEA